MSTRKPTTKQSVSPTSTSAMPIAATPAPARTPARRAARPTSALSPQPAPTPDPVALAAAVKLVIAALDSAETSLGIAGDPTLSPVEKRHAVRLRKGGEKYVTQISSLATQYQLGAPAADIATMLALVGKADALQPLVDRLGTFTKHVGDSVFSAQSQAWDLAMQYYAFLRRRASSNADLATSLQPIADFLAYRHPLTKPPVGSPTKRQIAAAKKAQQTLATVAGGKLADANLLNPRKHPAIPAGEPAPTAGAPAMPAALAAPATGGPGATAAPATALATNGGGAPTHS
jgi:hypothetical protein